MNIKKGYALPLRETIVYPGQLVTLYVGRASSIKSLEKAQEDSNKLIITLQTDSDKDDIKVKKDIYNVGVLVEIIQVSILSDSSLKLLVKGIERIKILDMNFTKDPFLTSYTEYVSDTSYNEEELKVLKENSYKLFTQYIDVTQKVSKNVLSSIQAIADTSQYIDTIASHLPIGSEKKQEILEKASLIERSAYINALIELELDLVGLEQDIRSKVKTKMEKNHRDYYLQEQIKVIKKEMSDGDNEDIQEYLQKLEKLRAPKVIKEKLEKEIKKLKLMNPISAEATVSRNYIEYLLSLPWNVKQSKSVSIKAAQKVLDDEHFGLEKIKERVLEQLAVVKRRGTKKAPILCFVGPPGVGKTSISKSIANALGRKFVRVALGGIKDEAEVRGHRKTYIGAMPGKIIQMIKKAGTSNPVVLLDEIDKLTSDYRGDPAAALLEVLDTEQNQQFVDNYLEVEYDLSDVMFIATANSLDMHSALLDRLEIIDFSSYTNQEKVAIANNYLVPSMKKSLELKDSEITIEDGIIETIISKYTKEAGVRNLSRKIEQLGRKSLLKLEQDKVKHVTINSKNLKDFLGVEIYIDTQHQTNKPLVGRVTGLAWTRVGGEILHIEVAKYAGTGKINFTGNLGDVMKESIETSFSLVKSHQFSAKAISKLELDKIDLHIHIPEGATPKDGPSAGIAITTAIFSIITDKPIRQDVAMTGEITLRGKVLAIGGLKEKLLAAYRNGIHTALIPKENERNLIELKKDLPKKLKIIPVDSIEEVIKNTM